MKINLLFTTLFIVFLAGCDTLGVLVEPRNPTPTQSTQTASTNQVHPRQLDRSNGVAGTGPCYRFGRKQDPVPWTTIEFVVSQDIDVAYTRIMREFGYQRFKQQYLHGTSIPTCFVYLRYEEIPGSHYQMRNFVKHAYGKEESENTIEVDLSKEGEGKVLVRVSYYSGNTLDKAGYEASLRNRVERALR
jgi:hypothetical protein